VCVSVSAWEHVPRTPAAAGRRAWQRRGGSEANEIEIETAIELSLIRLVARSRCVLACVRVCVFEEPAE